MLYIIANPLAGGGQGETNAAAVENELQKRNIPYRLFRTTYQKEAIELAKQAAASEECTGIIALGGDGTFNEVLNGIGNTDKPMGFICAGTGNDFARTLNLPTEPIAALDVILQGNLSKIDYLLVNDRRCINITGTGLDVEILECANSLRKKIKGKMSYYLALIKTLMTFSFRKYTIQVDGGEPFTEDAMMISVANGRMCGGGLPVAPSAVLDDGCIDFIMIKKLPRYQIPFLLLKFLKGKLLSLKPVSFIRCKTLKVLNMQPPLKLNMDGELEDMMPFAVRICEKALTIFTPKPIKA